MRQGLGSSGRFWYVLVDTGRLQGVLGECERLLEALATAGGTGNNNFGFSRYPGRSKSSRFLLFFNVLKPGTSQNIEFVLWMKKKLKVSVVASGPKILIFLWSFNVLGLGI